jgi:hypothetical protein
MDAYAGSDSNRHRSPIRFRLFTLLLIMTAVCLLLSYRATHRVTRVESSIGLRSHLLGSIGRAPRGDIDFLSRTQFVEPTDDRIIKQVITDPDVSGLLIIQNHVDPAAWLKESLEWNIDTEFESLRLRLLVPRGQQGQAQQVFDSVFRAFLEHAVVDDSVKEEIRALNRKE